MHSTTSSSETLIELRNVSVALNGHRVLHHIDWELKRGENWAVLGPNGAGKSTFLRLLRGEVWPAPVNGGTRIYNFEGKSTESAIGIKQRLAVVSAELQQRYVRVHGRRYGDDPAHGLTTQDVVFTGLLDSELVTRTPKRGENERVMQTMQRVGIAELAAVSFDKLSQGQLRKVLIARAVIGEPDVLILDEVGVGLDKRSRLQLLEMVQQVTEGGTQILMTTHRRDELIPAITRVIELRRGRVYEVSCLIAEGAEEQRTQQKSLNPSAASASPRSLQFKKLTPTHTRRSQPFHINICNASVALDEGSKVVLHDVTWRMNVGEHWMMVGDNGVGKSTLLKVLLGELWPSAGGTIERFGCAPQTASLQHNTFTNVWEIKKQIGYVSAELQTRYFVDLPADRVIASGFFAGIGWLQPTTRAQDKRVREVMAQLGLTDLAQRSILQMSYGQARKVLVARALVNQPRLLILDEVFDGLDAGFRAELSAVFEALAAQGTGIILVSHHEGDMLGCITHRMKIEGGHIVQQEVRAR
jgi:molybdate transport system ATP-binding protein